MNVLPLWAGGARSVTLDTNGKVGIGTTSPLHLLQVGGGVDGHLGFDGSDISPNAGFIRFGDNTGWKLHFGRARESSGGQLNTGVTGLGRFTPGLDAVMRLQPIRYEYRPDNALGLPSGSEHIGFAAQAVQKVVPDAVSTNDRGYLMVNNDPILWTMLNAIKEQQHAIQAQQQEIEQLRGELRQLRAAGRDGSPADRTSSVVSAR